MMAGALLSVAPIERIFMIDVVTAAAAVTVSRSLSLLEGSLKQEMHPVLFAMQDAGDEDLALADSVEHEIRLNHDAPVPGLAESAYPFPGSATSSA